MSGSGSTSRFKLCFSWVGGRAGESKTLAHFREKQVLGLYVQYILRGFSRGLKMSCPSPVVIMTGEWGKSTSCVGLGSKASTKVTELRLPRGRSFNDGKNAPGDERSID